MSGLLVADQDVIVAPNAQWVVDLEKDRWGFAASGSLAISVQQRPSHDLEVVFDVALGSANDLHCSWNGNPMEPSWTTADTGRLRIHIPAEELNPGTNAVTLVRTDSAAIRGEAEALQFREIRWNGGGPDIVLEPKKIHRYQHIAAFLLQGVTGSYTTEGLGGVLFVGVGTRKLPLPPGTNGELRFKVQNSAHGPARFILGSGSNEVSVQLDSHEKHLLSIPVEPGSTDATITVEGPPGGLYLWGSPHIFGEPEPDRPTILLITLDTTRRDAVFPYSDTPEMTPNLARFADHATIYTRAASTSPWTLPSHASMLTGRYPSGHRAGVTNQALAAHNVTVAEILRNANVMTAGFAGGVFCGSRFGLSQGFSIFHSPKDLEVKGDDLADLALQFLDQYATDHPFMFVNFFDPHFTYRAPEHFRQLSGAARISAGIPTGTIWSRILEGDGTAWAGAITDDVPFPEQALAAIRAEYLAEVAFMDEQIGRIFRRLRDHGLYESALIVVVADHGELLGEHRVLGHGGRLDPELVEVPLIVKFPNQRASVWVDDLVSVVDIFPTLIRASGLPPPPSDGIPLVEPGSQASSSREIVFAEEHEMGIHKLVGRLKIADHVYSIERSNERDVVWNDGAECYSLQDEVWVSSSCRIEQPMALIDRELSPPRLLAGQLESSLGADEMRKLKALGYVQ